MTTTIIPARERAQAPIGLPYIAPLMARAWFRCDITAGAGIYKLGRDVAGLKSVPIQVFANGEWHTVVGWDNDKCYPAWQRGLEHGPAVFPPAAHIQLAGKAVAGHHDPSRRACHEPVSAGKAAGPVRPEHPDLFRALTGDRLGDSQNRAEIQRHFNKKLRFACWS